MENTTSDNITRRCQNPACGKEFVMRRPTRPGKYGVNCPHCNAVNFFSLLDGKVPEQKTELPETTEVEVKANQPKHIQNVPDKTDIILEAHTAPSSVPVTVTSTDKSTSVTTVTKTSQPSVIQVENTEKRHYSQRFLALTAKSWSNKYLYQLTPGRHTIGAIDKAAVSDLMIKDNTMSARSVRIDVSEHDGKFLTTLHIIDSLNPVYINNQPLQPDRPYDILPDDRLILGSTIIEFKEAY